MAGGGSSLTTWGPHAGPVAACEMAAARPPATLKSSPADCLVSGSRSCRGAGTDAPLLGGGASPVGWLNPDRLGRLASPLAAKGGLPGRGAATAALGAASAGRCCPGGSTVGTAPDTAGAVLPDALSDTPVQPSSAEAPQGARVAHFWGAARATLLLLALAAATSRNAELLADASTGALKVRGTAPETAWAVLPAVTQAAGVGTLLPLPDAAGPPCDVPVCLRTP